MSGYAEGTKVAVTKTLAEIEDLVRKRGGQKFYRGEQEERMVLGWWQAERMVMFGVERPKLELFAKKPRGYGRRTVPEQLAAQEQACRSSWRALLLVIKAKLVSVESGVESFEEAFLAQLVVKDDEGRSVRFGTRAVRAINEAYTRNGPPQLMLGSGV